MKWCPLFSQSGGEILNVSRRLNRWPDAIITNKQSLEGINGELLANAFDKLIIIPNKPSYNDYNAAFQSIGAAEELLITLHGFLRIIPEAICHEYKMINSHPADIIAYPKLRGKDPVQRITEDMENIGVTMHKVSSIVDGGEIIAHQTYPNMLYDMKTNTDPILRKVGNELIIRRISEDLWVEYIQDILCK